MGTQHVTLTHAEYQISASSDSVLKSRLLFIHGQMGPRHLPACLPVGDDWQDEILEKGWCKPNSNWWLWKEGRPHQYHGITSPLAECCRAKPQPCQHTYVYGVI